MAETNAELQACRIVVSGRVQGVGFRASTREQARQLAVRGWVRNRPDGGVEVWAQSSAEALARFVHWLEEGPRLAEVRQMQTESVEPDPDLTEFEIRY